MPLCLRIVPPPPYYPAAARFRYCLCEGFLVSFLSFRRPLRLRIVLPQLGFLIVPPTSFLFFSVFSLLLSCKRTSHSSAGSTKTGCRSLSFRIPLKLSGFITSIFCVKLESHVALSFALGGPAAVHHISFRTLSNLFACLAQFRYCLLSAVKLQAHVALIRGFHQDRMQKSFL